MLFEPGPIALIDAAQFPTPGPRGAIEAAAADAIAALAGGAHALQQLQGGIAGAGALGVEPAVALALGEAAAEHERQARDSDPALGGVAASTDALEQELAGLSLTLGEDLRTPEPGYPEIPPGQDPAAPPREGPEQPPEADPPEKLPGWPNDPIGRCGAGGSGGDWIDLYRGYIENDVPRIHGRAATAFERELPNIYHYWFGYVDDCAYNWLLSTYVAPYPTGFEN